MSSYVRQGKISSIGEKDVEKFVNELLLKDRDIIEHSRRVRDICAEIVNNLDLVDYNVNEDLLYKAAWLHDIGKGKKLKKKYGKKNHHINAANEISYFFDCEEANKKIECRKLQSIIIAHRKNFEPDEDVLMEAAILRMADKIDKYNKPNVTSKQVKKVCKNSLNEIKNYFERTNCTEFEQFRKVCKKIRKEVKKELGD